MTDTAHEQIKKDKLIYKFCFYGFLKNLKFFEPFLIIYLLSYDLSLFKIGLLYSVREIINYIFEVPSGMFADSYGKKTELYLCFSFYIISFVLFFIGTGFAMFVAAMVFFGLGEAFRSGTHKAMILSYLEEKDWFSLKGFVYARTRFFSLLGSSVSAFASIVFILSFQSYKILFILCVIPYLLDFILIMTYPKRLNEKRASNDTLKGFIKQSIRQVRDIFGNSEITRTLMSSSVFDAIFKSVKDYIQPILQMMILSSSMSLVKNMDVESEIKVYLALLYGLLYIVSAMATKNVYRLTDLKSPRFIMNLFFDIMGASFLLIAIFMRMEMVYLVVALYFLIYIVKDARRPVFVDIIGECMRKEDRVTVLSLENQIKALLMAVFAPLFGFLADTYSISILFVIIGFLCLAVNFYIKFKERKLVA
jgi:MFS family permease